MKIEKSNTKLGHLILSVCQTYKDNTKKYYNY
jgi:hypothetical protein